MKLLEKNKPVIGMLHMGGRGSTMEIVDRMLFEAETYLTHGIDALLLEDYFGTVQDVEKGLLALSVRMPHALVGVNILSDFQVAFELADAYGAGFVQIDSVAGHLHPAFDMQLNNEIMRCRTRYPDITLLGGLRFKYQPVKSGRSLQEDAGFAMRRCDAIVTTGDATAKETPMAKLIQVRAAIGPDKPLIVGAGATADNIRPQLEIADGVIVGSYLKRHGVTENPVDKGRVREFMAAVLLARSADMELEGSDAL